MTSSRSYRRLVRRIGAAVRFLGGIPESAFKSAPHERTRYTALGWIVLITALFSSLSMFVACAYAFRQLPLAIAVLISAAWGGFVLNIDRWLISATVPRRRIHAIAVFVPRILLAGIIGFIIAEPIVLAVFNGPIESQVREDRERSLAQYKSQLTACNTLDGRSGSAICQEYQILAPAVDDAERQAILLSLRQEVSLLERQVAVYSNQQVEAADRAIRECNGVAGSESSGLAGDGPNCRRNREEADRYRAEADRARGQLLELQTYALRSEQQLSARRRDAIDQQVAARDNRNQDIGLLERVNALSDLGGQSVQFVLMQWAIRLLIVFVEAMPAFVRVAIGRGTVDDVIEELASQNYGILHRHHELENLRSQMEVVSLRTERDAVQRHAAALKQIEEARLQSEWEQRFEETVKALMREDTATRRDARASIVDGSEVDIRADVDPGPGSRQDID